MIVIRRWWGSTFGMGGGRGARPPGLFLFVVVFLFITGQWRISTEKVFFTTKDFLDHHAHFSTEKDFLPRIGPCLDLSMVYQQHRCSIKVFFPKRTSLHRRVLRWRQNFLPT